MAMEETKSNIDRIKFLDIMKRNAMVPRQLIECFSCERPTLFYGCGNQGLVCEEMLVNFMKFKVDGFVVSDEYYDINRCYATLPIYPLSSIPFKKEECNILLTMGGEKARVIAKDLIEMGFRYVYLIEDWESTNMLLREIVFQFILDKHSVKFTKEDRVFSYQSFYFLNPFKEKHNYLTMFLGEFNSLVVPHIFKDYDYLQVEGPYEYGEVKPVQGDVVIDCGANIGLFSAAAAALGSKVYAFEPVKFIADYLQRTADLYEDDAIEVINKALSDHVGEISFKQVEEDFHVLGWSTAVLASEDEKNAVLQATTIDEFVKEKQLSHVDFIKSDIEGAEREMLRGATMTLKEFSPKLAICTYHLPDDKEVLKQIILDANPNYVIEYHWEKLFAYVPEK